MITILRHGVLWILRIIITDMAVFFFKYVQCEEIDIPCSKPQFYAEIWGKVGPFCCGYYTTKLRIFLLLKNVALFHGP